MTVSGQFSCPPPGSYMAVSGQSPVAAVSPPTSSLLAYAEIDRWQGLRKLTHSATHTRTVSAGRAARDAE
jgi:hypothetical protein